MSEDTDPLLWKLVVDGITSFEETAGTGGDWKDIIRHPPYIFLIDDEIQFIEDAKSMEK